MLDHVVGDVHTGAQPGVDTGRSLVPLVQIKIVTDSRIDLLGVQRMRIQPLVRELQVGDITVRLLSVDLSASAPEREHAMTANAEEMLAPQPVLMSRLGL
jgi:hypothetical protein